MGLPDWIVGALTEYNKAFSEGSGDFTTNGVEEITATRPALMRLSPATSPRRSRPRALPPHPPFSNRQQGANR